MMKSILALLLTSIPFLGFCQQTSVLFLGNSYTAVNNLPNTFHDLSLAGGDSVFVDANTPGGYTLEGHSTNATSLAKIADRDWDFVVLQEQSQRPSFPPSQVTTDVYPYAEILVDSIRSNNACTEPVFYMTWGRLNGDQQNCQFYPPLCTYAGMQGRLRESYIEMGFDNNARIAPCGAAWSRLEQVDSIFFSGLYSGDGSHPSAWGTYFNACVFYATIFHKSPVGIEWYSNIGEPDAVVLQGLAEEVVMDSLNTWNSLVNLPRADVSYTTDNMEVSFENLSYLNVNDNWDFGDGEQSTDSDPTHTYSTPNIYEVIYVADNGCGDFDTTSISVTVINTGISSAGNRSTLIQNNGNGSFNITWGEEVPRVITIVDVSGKIILSNGNPEEITGISLTQFPEGVYVLNARFSDGHMESVKLAR